MPLIRDIMTKAVVTVEMDESLRNLADLLAAHHFHHLLVVKNRRVVGVISDRDVLRHLSPFIGKMLERPQDTDTLKKKAHQLMTRALVAVTEDTTVGAAADLMLDHDVFCLPVLDDQGYPRGIISWRDLLKVLVAGRVAS